MGIDKVGKAAAQKEVAKVENKPKETLVKEQLEAVQTHAVGKLLSEKNTKSSKSKKSVKTPILKKNGKPLSEKELKKLSSLNDELEGEKKNLNKMTDKLKNKKTLSKQDGEDYLHSMKRFSVILFAMIAMLKNQSGSQSEITSLGNLSQNLNDAVTAWQRTSTFWLTAFYQYGKKNDDSGGFAPGVNPGNVNNPTPPDGIDKKAYPGVANSAGSQITIMMGIYNHLSTKFSGASQRLATTAGLPGQLTTSINSQIQTGMSAMQALQQANSSMLQSVMQWS